MLNHTHLTEMLAEREGIDLSRSTMRRILLAGGLRSPRIRRLQALQPTGALSPGGDAVADRWEPPGFALPVLGAVDDATGTVPFALFRQQEDRPC